MVTRISGFGVFCFLEEKKEVQTRNKGTKKNNKNFFFMRFKLLKINIYNAERVIIYQVKIQF